MSLHKRIAAHRARAYLRMVGHALRYRRMAQQAKFETFLVRDGDFVEACVTRQRSERAEALLREADEVFTLLEAELLEDVQEWRARVRDLLEGKT